jgi:hypothetical protein
MAFRVAPPSLAPSLDPTDKSQRRIRDAEHLAWIRTLPSIISGQTPCEACHIRYGDPSYRKKRTGMGQKPDDAWCLPMTREEHRSQHGANEATWWSWQGINPLAVAQQLYQNSGDTEAALAILATAKRKPALWRPGTSEGD